MNPPYGREIAQWFSKAFWSAMDGATVVCLLPARPETRWWQHYIRAASHVTFIRGRLRFVGAPYNAPFPSALVAFGPLTALQHETLAQFGWTPVGGGR
jgi:site-specific DNA-methyltransferase (adenine-specific)